MDGEKSGVAAVRPVPKDAFAADQKPEDAVADVALAPLCIARATSVLIGAGRLNGVDLSTSE
jgi:hypothetical protein